MFQAIISLILRITRLFLQIVV